MVGLASIGVSLPLSWRLSVAEGSIMGPPACPSRCIIIAKRAARPSFFLGTGASSSLVGNSATPNVGGT